MQISPVRDAIATAARAVVLPSGVPKLTSTGYVPDAVTEPHVSVIPSTLATVAGILSLPKSANASNSTKPSPPGCIPLAKFVTAAAVVRAERRTSISFWFDGPVARTVSDTTPIVRCPSSPVVSARTGGGPAGTSAADGGAGAGTPPRTAEITQSPTSSSRTAAAP